MVNWVPIVPAMLGAAPAAALFFVSYGRYDGAFRDNVVFLYFIGGLILGGFLAVLLLFVFGTGAALLQLLGVAVLVPMAVLACINRRKWQGERHAVFNGGALGLGIAVMMAFTFLYYRLSREIAAGSSADIVFSPVRLAQGLLLASALAGLLFGFGLLMGDAVRRRAQWKAAFAAVAIGIAPALLLQQHITGGDWLTLVLLTVYGAVFAFAADRRLLIHGVEDEARKARRRARRKNA